eukprot:jgi/Chrzof1/12996/Cz07g15210.t1
MFKSLIQDCAEKRSHLSSSADLHEQSATATVPSLTGHLVDDLNEEAREVYETQKVIEHESQLLRKELADFQSQLKTWTSKVTQLQATLKHVGDIEHYVCVLSRQAQALAVVLSSTQGEEQEVAQHPGDVETVVGSEPGAEQAAVADQLPVSRRAAG